MSWVFKHRYETTSREGSLKLRTRKKYWTRNSNCRALFGWNDIFFPRPPSRPEPMCLRRWALSLVLTALTHAHVYAHALTRSSSALSPLLSLWGWEVMILPDLGRFIYIIRNSRVQALFLFQGKFNYEIQKCSCSIIKGMKFLFFS